MNRKFRYGLKFKIMLITSISFMLLLSISMGITYKITERVIVENIKLELESNSNLIKIMIEKAMTISIKTQLRSIAEKNLEIISYYKSLQEKGLLSKEEAQEKAFEILSLQKIGDTGYVYILDSNGKLIYHPRKSLINQDISEYQFVKDQIELKSGYIEYKWKNPEDLSEREKALYMFYYSDWDWIISASSYKNEFLKLIDIDDFKEDILNIKFGKSGYPIIIKDDGTFLIHPKLEGVNTTKNGDEQGFVIKNVIEQKNGIIEYKWRNPEEKKAREKIAAFKQIDDYNWIVSSSSYKEDFYQPINKIRNIFLVILIIGLVFIVYITSKITKSIIKPLESLKETIKKAVDGDLFVRIEKQRNDEIGEIGQYFNVFMQSLQDMTKELNVKIYELEQTKDELINFNNELEVRVEERTKEVSDNLIRLEEAQEQLIRAEKFSVIGRLIADVAHHMNTPIGSIITLISFLKRETEKIEDDFLNRQIGTKKLELYLNIVDNAIKIIEENSKKISEMINDFKGLRESVYYKEIVKFNLNNQIEDIVMECKRQVEMEDVDIKINCPKDLEIISFKGIYKSIFFQVISNSKKHAFADSSYKLIEIDVQKNKNILKIEIKDNGIGMSEEECENIFEPFYTVKKDSQNIGLGLNIVYNAVVNILKGKVECISKLGEGTMIKIEVPIDIKIKI